MVLLSPFPYLKRSFDTIGLNVESKFNLTLACKLSLNYLVLDFALLAIVGVFGCVGK